MVRKLGSRLDTIKSLKLNVLESEPDTSPLLVNRLAHKRRIILVNDGKKQIRYCQRCKVSWPCLVAQLEAIDRGRLKKTV